jgi:pimeloyl-ACP methyl ester carboxylesterase
LFRNAWTAVGVALIALAASSATAQAADPPVPAIPERYLEQEVEWSTCSFDAQVKAAYPEAPTTSCAMVTVPMDWHAPDAHPDVQVAIAHSPATGSSKGLMASNPGGPGAAGLTLSAALALSKPQLFRDYDLLGFDPRGFGSSTPLRCLTTVEELEALPTTPDRRERTAATHRAERAEAALLADACSATEFGRFVSTQQTVYDLELVRALLDRPRLNFIGYSYGTWLGGWYADTYPSRVGRFVLDSNMDWTNTQWENMNYDPFSFQRRRDVQLLPWIARQSDQIEGLGTTARQVRARYEAIRAALVARVKAGTSGVRGDGLDGNVASAIYGNTGFVVATLDILVHDEFVADPDAGAITAGHVEAAWARLDAELQAFFSLGALKSRYGVGDVARTASDLIAEAREDAAGAPPDQEVDLGAVGTTVRCNDTVFRRGAAYYTAMADLMTRLFPFFGYLNGVPMCAFWPYPPQDRVVDLAGSPRLLMISSEFDPATVFEGGLRTHVLTRKATRLVAIDDEGQHGQYVGSRSPCAEAAGDAFVFDGVMQPADLVCATTPLPAESSVFAVPGPVDLLEAVLRGPAPRSAAAQRNPMLRRILERASEYLN